MSTDSYYCAARPVPGTPLALRFAKDSRTRTINPENYKTLGIFDEIESWVYKQVNSVYMWGTAVCDYGNHTRYGRRPWITVASPVEYTITGDSKVLVVNYNDPMPQIWSETVEISNTSFNSSNFTVGASISLEAGVNIGVFSSRATAETNFSSATSRSQTLTYSRITTLTMSASAGRQIRAVTNPTFNTTFEVTIDGDIIIWQLPEHTSRAYYYNKNHPAQVTVKDNGSTVYINEPIPGWSSLSDDVLNVNFKGCSTVQSKQYKLKIDTKDLQNWDIKLRREASQLKQEKKAIKSNFKDNNLLAHLVDEEFEYFAFEKDLSEDEKREFLNFLRQSI